MQWNFLPGTGVNAPVAWDNVLRAGRPGGRGVVIAVLDTGVAYADRGRYRRSPDLAGPRFRRGYDFIDDDAYPNDANGHGTHVASTIAESINNGVGVTGLAYGARVMPVRVLNGAGEGNIAEIAAGIRFAARRGAQIINLSFEFGQTVTAGDIPDLLAALRYARAQGGARGGRVRQQRRPVRRLSRTVRRGPVRRRHDRARVPRRLLQRRHRPRPRGARRRARRRSPR